MHFKQICTHLFVHLVKLPYVVTIQYKLSSLFLSSSSLMKLGIAFLQLQLSTQREFLMQFY